MSGSDRDDVKRVDNIEKAVQLFDDNVALCDHDEFRMRYWVFLPVRCADEERADAGEMLSNELGVHGGILRRHYLKSMDCGFRIARRLAQGRMAER